MLSETDIKARHYVRYNRVHIVSANKGNLHFQVQGSEKEPYDVFRSASGVWSCNALKREIRNGKLRAWGCILNPNKVCSHVKACQLWLKPNKTYSQINHAKAWGFPEVD
jgi:hypothetical protein